MLDIANVTTRRRVFLAIALIILALTFSPVGTIETDEFAITTVHIAVILGAILLDWCYGLALGACFGAASMLRAMLLPPTAFDALFANPLISVLPRLLVGLVPALVFSAARAVAGPRALGTALSALLAAVLGTLVNFAGVIGMLALVHPDVMHADSLPALVSMLRAGGSFLNLAVETVLAVLVTVPVAVLLFRRQAAQKNRRLRETFQKWLFAFVALAFLVTFAISFYMQTKQADRNAEETLNKELHYVRVQLRDNEKKALRLKNFANKMLLEKAQALNEIVKYDPAVLTRSGALEEICETLGLDELYVTDDTAVIIRSVPSVYEGAFDFHDYDTTRKYIELIDHPEMTIVEEPRANDAEKAAGVIRYQQYAGVSRADAPGIVQVAFSNSQYTDSLAAVSVESLATDYTIGQSGSLYVLQNGVIVSATDAGLVGSALADMGLTTALPDVVAGEWRIVSVSIAGSRCLAGYAECDGYRLLAVLPESEVYAGRDNLATWNLIFYLVLFAVVFVLISRLLDSVVIRGIDKTNAVLKDITAGNLNQRVDVRSNEEFQSLSDGINTTVDALKVAIAEAAARIDQELEFARAIQSSAIPRVFPPFPEIPDFDLYAHMDPAKEIGGDFYDFFLTDDGRLAFVIADVSGKGIPAALFMMTAKTHIQNYLKRGGEPGATFAAINHELCQHNDAGMFVTVFAGLLDYHTGALTYVNAGHNPPLLLRNGACEYLRNRSGLMLGSFDGIRFRAFSDTLRQGERLLLYTDGATEAMNPAGELFGEERFRRLVTDNAALAPDELLPCLRAGIDRFANGAEQADDITMLALAFGKAPKLEQSLTLPAAMDSLEPALALVRDLLGAHKCPAPVATQMEVALEELVVNIISYAYPDGGGTFTIDCAYRPEPPRVTVKLADAGAPFNPLLRADPEAPKSAADAKIGGLGILMVKKMMDEVAYRYEENQNVLTITKRF